MAKIIRINGELSLEDELEVSNKMIENCLKNFNFPIHANIFIEMVKKSFTIIIKELKNEKF